MSLSPRSVLAVGGTAGTGGGCGSCGAVHLVPFGDLDWDLMVLLGSVAVW
jgi:hypothetical protein